MAIDRSFLRLSRAVPCEANGGISGWAVGRLQRNLRPARVNARGHQRGTWCLRQIPRRPATEKGLATGVEPAIMEPAALLRLTGIRQAMLTIRLLGELEVLCGAKTLAGAVWRRIGISLVPTSNGTRQPAPSAMMVPATRSGGSQLADSTVPLRLSTGFTQERAAASFQLQPFRGRRHDLQRATRDHPAVVVDDVPRRRLDVRECAAVLIPAAALGERGMALGGDAWEVAGNPADDAAGPRFPWARSAAQKLEVT